MSFKGKQHHVMPNKKDGGWDILKSGAERASAHFELKQQAVDTGRKISQNQRTELFIHGLDNRIQSRDSHGNDPYPPKG
jgi:hypothetical protein